MESAVDVVTEPTIAEAEPAVSSPSEDEVLADVLVEEISIDGMCGVY